MLFRAIVVITYDTCRERVTRLRLGSILDPTWIWGAHAIHVNLQAHQAKLLMALSRRRAGAHRARGRRTERTRGSHRSTLVLRGTRVGRAGPDPASSETSLVRKAVSDGGTKQRARRGKNNRSDGRGC